MISLRRCAALAVALAAYGAGCGGGVSKYKISGSIDGAVSAGVTLALSGASSGTAMSEASGAFAFTVEEGSYTVTPSLSGYSFSPSSRAITVEGRDVTGVTFTATAVSVTRSIIGGVNGAVSAGVTVSAVGPTTGSAVTNATGGYTISGLTEGSYTVTPSLSGYTFDPASRTIALSGGDALGVDFVASAVPTHSISGTVSGAVAQGVSVSLGGAHTASTVSGAAGAFSFSGLADGSYTVTPSLSGYTFDPASRTIALSGGDALGVDFVASAVPTHSISGTVSGAVAQGVSVSLGGAHTASTVSGAAGAFSFSGLADGSYTVTPSLSGYTFDPASRTIALSGGDALGVDFTSAAVVPAVVLVTGDIAADTVWTSDHVYVVSGNIGVSATLTIQPGTVVKFQTGDGKLEVTGRILAVATVAAPIVFTSLSDDSSGGDTNGDGASVGSPADWIGIALAASGSVFDDCKFLYAGAGDSSALWISTEGASVAVTNSTFAHHRPATDTLDAAAALGLTIAGRDTVVTGNLFYDDRVPLSVNTLFDLDDSNLFDNSAAAPGNPQPNQFNGVIVRGCGEVIGPVSWAENDVPLVVGTPATCNHVSVALGRLSVEPGVVMKFLQGGYLVVTEEGAMTIGSGVAFTSINDDARKGDTNADDGAQAPSDTDWAGIRVHSECLTLPNIYYATCD